MRKVVLVALKTAMFASGRTQERIAKLAGMMPQDLSHALYGRRVLTDTQRKNLAKVLEKSQAELFPEEQAIAS